MRVTFVALNYAPSRGGAQEHVRRVAEGLVARGVEVSVLTTDALRSPAARDPGHVGPASEELNGIEVHRFAIPRAVSWLQRAMGMAVARVRRWSNRSDGPLGPWLIGPWSPSLMRAVWRAARDSDVVVGCSAPFATQIVPVWCRSSKGARIVSMPLLHASRCRPHPVVRWALRHSDLVLASTQFEADVDEEIGVDPAKVVVIPPGVDSADFPPMTPEEARIRCGLPPRATVGFIGRLAAYKGIDTLLEAAPLLWEQYPDTTVLIAGSTTGWEAYRDLAAGLGRGDHLVIREGFPSEDRATLVSACDVVVHPSSDESFGLMALEAWAARRPVVLGDIPCVRSFGRPGETVELVDLGDAAGLARILGELLDDAPRRERLAAAGHAELAQGFEWDRICASWHDAITRLVAGER